MIPKAMRQLFIILLLFSSLLASSLADEQKIVYFADSYYDANESCLYPFHTRGRMCYTESDQVDYYPSYNEYGEVNKEIWFYKNQNLLIDGGFDSHDKSLFMVADDTASFGRIDCYDGSCLTLSIPAHKQDGSWDYADIRFLPTEVDPSKEYFLSFFATSSAPLPKPLSVLINYFTGPYTPASRTIDGFISSSQYYFPELTDSWERYILRIGSLFPPDTKYITVQFFFQSDDAPTGSAVIDSVQLEEIQDKQTKPTPYERSTYVVKYTYFHDGKIKSILDPGMVTRSYYPDLLGRITSVTVTIPGEEPQVMAEYTYNEDHLIETKDFGDGTVFMDFTYNPRGHITDYLAQYGGSTEIDESFQYDPAGNLKKITDDTTSYSADFTYDTLHRLTTVADSGYYLRSLAFAYNDEGDRISKDDQAYTYYGGNSNRLLSDGSWSYTYDAAGRVILIKCEQGVGCPQGAYTEIDYTPTGAIKSMNHFKPDGSREYTTNYAYDIEDNLYMKESITDRFYREKAYIVRDSGGEIIYQENYKFCNADDYLNTSYEKSSDCCERKFAEAIFDQNSTFIVPQKWMAWGEDIYGVDYAPGETECCGDDLNESINFYEDWTADMGGCYAPGDNCSGTTYTNESDLACCDKELDCVAGGKCYSKRALHDIAPYLDDDVDVSADQELCVYYGTRSGWQDADIGDSNLQSKTYCESVFGGKWIVDGVKCESAYRWGDGLTYCDDTESGFDATGTGTEGINSNYCCGDDPFEFYIQGTDNTAACCDSATDRVMNGVCYSLKQFPWNAKMDVADSGLPYEWEKEGALTLRENTGQWPQQVQDYIDACYDGSKDCTCIADRICLVPINFTAEHGILKTDQLKVDFTLDSPPTCKQGHYYFDAGTPLQVLVDELATPATASSFETIAVTSPSTFSGTVGGSAVAPIIEQASAVAGFYSFTYTATQKPLRLGRPGLTCSNTIQISVGSKNLPPVIVAPGYIEVNESQVVQFPVTASDPDPGQTGIIVHKYDSNMEGRAGTFKDLPGQFFSNNRETGSFTWQTGYDDSGLYVMSFQAIDPHTATSRWVTTVIRVLDKNRDPECEIPDQEVTEAELLEFTVAGYVTDLDGDTITYESNAEDDRIIPVYEDFVETTGAPAFDKTTGTFSWTPDYAQASNPVPTKEYSVDFSFYDGRGGSCTDSAIIRVHNANRDPFIYNPPDGETYTTKEGQMVQVQMNYSDLDVLIDGDMLGFEIVSIDPEIDPDAYVLSYMIDPEFPEWNDIEHRAEHAAEFLWTPNEEDSGTYTVTFTTWDLADSAATSTFIIEVEDVDRPPEIDVPDQKIDMGQTIQINLDDHSSDPDMDTLYYDITNQDITKVTCTPTGARKELVDITNVNDYYNMPGREYPGDTPLPSCTAYVEDRRSGTDTDDFTIEVWRYNKLPKLSLTASPASAKNKLETTLTCTATEGDPPYRYVWDFGDGTTDTDEGTGPSVRTHDYTETGKYTVTCTAHDSWSDLFVPYTSGDKVEKSIPVEVVDLPPIQESFTINKLVRCDTDPTSITEAFGSLTCTGKYTVIFEIDKGHCNDWSELQAYFDDALKRNPLCGGWCSFDGKNGWKERQLNCANSEVGDGKPGSDPHCGILFDPNKDAPILYNAVNGEGMPGYYLHVYTDADGTVHWGNEPDYAWLEWCQMQSNEDADIILAYTSGTELWQGETIDNKEKPWLEEVDKVSTVDLVSIEGGSGLKVTFDHQWAPEKTQDCKDGSAGSLTLRRITFISDDYDVNCNTNGILAPS